MNQQQKYILNLQRKPKERKREKVFIIEGRKLFEEVSREQLVMTLVSESFLHTKGAAGLLSGVSYDVVPDGIFETLSDTKTPQGILAVVRQAEYQLEDLFGDGKQAPFLLVLEHVQDPGNLGTMMRAAEAAGVTGVLMSGDCVDIYNPKTVRATMGALFRVPFVIASDFSQALDELKKNGIHTYAAHLEGSSSYDTCSYREGTAFLIGNEANGLTDLTTQAADHRIRIPMAGQVESLNAAMAATVLMFEAARQRRI